MIPTILRKLKGKDIKEISIAFIKAVVEITRIVYN